MPTVTRFVAMFHRMSARQQRAVFGGVCCTCFNLTEDFNSLSCDFMTRAGRFVIVLVFKSYQYGTIEI